MAFRISKFTVEQLIQCYQQGLFPMGEARDDERIYLVEPDMRGVIPLDGFHLSRRLARTVKSGLYEIRTDTAFAEVMRQCAKSREGREDTWINSTIRGLYGELHARGQAHSVEAWWHDQLVGGLYGVSLGGAFFGESMFSVARDASKVALAHLVARLNAGGYRLLDAQFTTDHLAQFGTVEITQEDYLARLDAALVVDADFYRLAAGAGPEAVLQAISQAS
jgi:leucyl/phenylalanyl-tRNA--protein transferase